jgi:hypothetical protein
VWVWLTAALGVFFALSVAVGLALGRVFATIGRQLAELEETELWSSWQPPRRTTQRREAPTSASVDSRSRLVGSSAGVPSSSSNRRR